MKTYTWMILPMYLTSIITALSSSSWMMIWMSMEMNLLTFLFLIFKNKSFSSSESSMKYYMIQSIGSLMFLFSMSSQKFMFTEQFSLNALVPPIALMFKMGSAPFHNWMPEVSFNMNYPTLFIFLTLQKIIPMITFLSSWNQWTIWIIPLNLMVGAVGSITQSSLNKMMTYSSINNIAWMMMAIIESLFMFYLFFLIYTMTTFMMMFIMNKYKIKWIGQIKSQNNMFKMTFSSLLFSFSGLPPFIGFIPKWLILKKICFSSPLFSVMSILLSSMTLYFYMKMSLKLVLSSSCTNKLKINNNFNLTMFMNLTVSAFPMFFLMT